MVSVSGGTFTLCVLMPSTYSHNNFDILMWEIPESLCLVV